MYDRKPESEAGKLMRNRDRERERQRLWRQSNPEKDRAKWKRYYTSHSTELNKKAQQWRNKNKERVKQSWRNYYKANHERMLSRALIAHESRKTPCLGCGLRCRGVFCNTCRGIIQLLMGKCSVTTNESLSLIPILKYDETQRSYQCLKSKKQAQQLRKQLLKTLQSQTTEKAQSRSGSSRVA